MEFFEQSRRKEEALNQPIETTDFIEYLRVQEAVTNGLRAEGTVDATTPKVEALTRVMFKGKSVILLRELTDEDGRLLPAVIEQLNRACVPLADDSISAVEIKYAFLDKISQYWALEYATNLEETEYQDLVADTLEEERRLMREVLDATDMTEDDWNDDYDDVRLGEQMTEDAREAAWQQGYALPDRSEREFLGLVRATIEGEVKSWLHGDDIRDLLHS